MPPTNGAAPVTASSEVVVFACAPGAVPSEPAEVPCEPLEAPCGLVLDALWPTPCTVRTALTVRGLPSEPVPVPVRVCLPGLADAPSQTCVEKSPCESAVAVPTAVPLSAIATLEPGRKPVPEKVAHSPALIFEGVTV